MIQSHDELIMEMTEEYGLNHLGENNEDEDDDDEGNAVTPPAPVPPAAAPKEINEEEALVEMVPKQEAPVVHEVILADPELEPPQPCLFNMIMRDYEESPPRMANAVLVLDDLDDLDDLTEACSDMDEWFPEDGSNDRD
jgi:hypothetical protein